MHTITVKGEHVAEKIALTVVAVQRLTMEGACGVHAETR